MECKGRTERKGEENWREKKDGEGKWG